MNVAYKAKVTQLGPDEQALLDRVPPDGRGRGHGPIQRELGWDEARYEQVKAALISKGILDRARGRGGAIKRRVTQGQVKAIVVVGPEVSAGWTKDEVKLFQQIPPDGSSIGNKRLRTLLGWDEPRYWEARDSLIDREKIGKGQGRGGSVYRLSELEYPDASKDSSAESSTAEAGEEAVDELSLYPAFEVYLKNRARDELGLSEQYFVQLTAHQGRRQTGGKWTRPDFLFVFRPRFKHIPDRRLEVQSFEIKLPRDAIAGVYETVAHARNVHRAYLAVCTSDDTEWTDTAEYERVKSECERLGVGLILFDDPEDEDAYEVIIEATPDEPEESDLDAFIDTQVASDNKERLRSWYH